MFGRGATKARAFINSELIVCTLEGALTRSDSTLVERGLGAEVSQQRRRLYELARQDMVAAVEAKVEGRRVRSYLAAVDPTSGVDVIVFVLEPDAASATDDIERPARIAQARSRTLSDAQRALPAEQHQVAAELARRASRRPARRTRD